MKLLLFITAVFGVLSTAYSATYNHPTSGSSSSTISATSGAPDFYYDDGGSGSNYSDNISGTTYTFTPNTGSYYIRVKIVSLSLGAGDQINIYNGGSTSDRKIGEIIGPFDISSSDPFFWVSTDVDGEITFEFTSDGTTNDTGWEFEVYEGQYQGQEWTGSTNSDFNTPSNWEGSLLPTAQSSIYIPNVANDPDISSSHSVFDFRLATGASFTRTGGALTLYGDLYIEGTFNVTGAYTVLNGGSAGNFANVGGTGSFGNIALLVGFNQAAYYQLANSITDLWMFEMSTNYSSEFDMNNFNLTVDGTSANRFNLPAGQTFYQRTGTLTIFSSSATFTDASFNEGTGTTSFGRAGTQTVPSATYYNLTVAGGGSNTKTLGGAVTISNDLTIDASTILNTDAGNSYKITISGNWINNGTYTGNSSEVEFTGAGAATVSGSSVTTFEDLQIDKGTDVTSSLEFTVETHVADDIIFTNGLLHINHASCTVVDRAASDPDIATTAGLHLAAGTYTNTDGNTLHMDGKLQVSGGTMTFGVGSGDNIIANTATADVDISGGTINAASRFRIMNGDADITGGSITVGIYGANSSSNALFHVDAEANFTFSAGTIYIQDENIAASGIDLNIESGGTKNLTGGTFQIGNGSTPASTTFDIYSEVLIDNLVVNTANTPTVNLLANLEVNNLTNNGVFDVDNTNTSHYSLTINESFTHTGTLNERQGTITYSGTGAQTVVAETYYNLVIGGGGSSVKTLGGAIIVDNNLTIDASTTLNTDAGNSYKITVSGSWVNNGTYTGNSSEVEFTGASVETVSGSSNTSFYDLRLDKGSDVTSTLEFTVDTDVSNNMVFENGLLIITHASCVVNDQVSADPDVATTAGVHINGGTYNTTNSFVYNMNGKFLLSSGTANIGIASGNTFYANNAAVDIDITGGTLNCSSRFRVTNGDVDITGGTINLGINGANTTISALFQVQADANLTFSGGTVNLVDENIHATGQDIRIMAGSSKDLTGGTFQIGTASTPASTTFDIYSEVTIDNLVVNATNTPTANLINNLTVNDLTVNGAFEVSTYTLTISDNCDINGTIQLSTGTIDVNGSYDATGGNTTFTDGGLLYLGGAVTSLGTFTKDVGVVYYDFAGDQNVIGANYHLLVFSSSGTKTLTGDISLSGNMTIDNSVTLDASASDFNITFTGGHWINNGSFNAREGALIIDGNNNIMGSNETTFHDITINNTRNLNGRTAGNATFSLTGNFTNNGTFTHNDGIVKFSGTAVQTISGTTETIFHDFTIDNSNGVSLGTNCTVENTFTFTNGRLSTQGYELTIGTTSANGTINGESSSNYFVAYNNGGTIGTLTHRINSNATYEFPIGTLTAYTPATFTLNSNGGLATAEVSVYTDDGINDDFNTTTIPGYVNREWDVTSSGITTPNYDISYVYVDGDIVGDESNYLPVKISGAVWYGPTNSTFKDETEEGTGSVTAGTNTLTWTGLESFSKFSGAEDTWAVLPVELVSFELECQVGMNPRLLWATASEINSDYFSIEGSNDGSEWVSFDMVAGAGNSTYYIDYDVTVSEDYNFYRLQQVDFDGTYEYFAPVANTCQTETTINVFYSNTSDQLILNANESLEGIMQVIVYDNAGKVISNEAINAHKLRAGYKLESQLSAGMYFIRVVNETFDQTLKVQR